MSNGNGPDPPSFKAFANFFLALPLLTMAGIIFIFEAIGSFSTSGLFCSGWIAAAVCLTVGYWRRFRSKVTLLLGGLFIGYVLLLHFRDTFPRGPYLRFYDAVQVGMDEAQVMEQLRLQFPPGGRFALPKASHLEPGLVLVLDPSDGRYNAKVIWLTLNDGRVVDKKYSHD